MKSNRGDWAETDFRQKKSASWKGALGAGTVGAKKVREEEALLKSELILPGSIMG